jgi:hypothetical protein
VWDRRQAASTVQLTHGSPVEAVLLMPNGTLLVTAGEFREGIKKGAQVKNFAEFLLK